MPLKPPDFDQWFTASAGMEPDGSRFTLHQDSGSLWLLLPDALTMLTLETPDTDGESWAEVLYADVCDNGASLTTLTDPGQDEVPVVAGFSTGGGDGRYPTWAGRTAEGDITCFATDFMLRESRPVR